MRDQFQRNALSRGYQENSPEDWIMISDIDEIPDPKKLANFNLKNKYACFVQKNFQQKLNLLNTTHPNWYGTKICIKKFLKSPQWLRDIKMKKSFWKIYKPNPPQLIFDGGWHFSFVKNSKNISNKIKSYAHQEYNKDKFHNINSIDDKISQNKDILERDLNYKKIE